MAEPNPIHEWFAYAFPALGFAILIISIWGLLVQRRYNRQKPETAPPIKLKDAFDEMMKGNRTQVTNPRPFVPKELRYKPPPPEVTEHIRSFKYNSSLITGDVRMRIYAGSDIDSRAYVYSGEEYSLYNNNPDTPVYFFDHEYAVPEKLLQKLNLIREVLMEFYRSEYPADPYLNYNTLNHLLALEQERADATSAINAIFLGWYLLEARMLAQWNSPLVSEDIEYLSLKSEYESDARFVFILGWLMSETPWYFHAAGDETSRKEYLLRAHQMQPDNPLYKWAVSKELNLTHQETRALAAQVTAAAFDGLEPFIKDYFMDMVQGDAQMK